MRQFVLTGPKHFSEYLRYNHDADASPSLAWVHCVGHALPMGDDDGREDDGFRAEV